MRGAPAVGASLARGERLRRALPHHHDPLVPGAGPPFARQIQASVMGDSAFVHWTTTITATLHLYTEGSVDHPKPFSDLATREAIFDDDGTAFPCDSNIWVVTYIAGSSPG